MSTNTLESLDKKLMKLNADFIDFPSSLKFERFLGRGTIGEVYQAQYKENQSVAIKLIRPNDSAFNYKTQTLQNEAGVLNDLLSDPASKNKVIKSLPYCINHNGYNFLVSELITCDAREFVKKYKPTLKQRLKLIRAYANQFDYVHSKGYCHRDIKPENLSVKEVEHILDENTIEMTGFDKKGKFERKYFHPVILDYGISSKSKAKYSGEPEGKVSGTAVYLAPEVIMGEKADSVSDIYSFCASAFEMIYEGSHAIPAKKGEDPFNYLVRKTKEHNVEFPLCPDSAYSKIYDGINSVLLKGLSHNPNDRQQSMKEFSCDISRIINN
jgi:serine/threonine protein kinase